MCSLSSQSVICCLILNSNKDAVLLFYFSSDLMVFCFLVFFSYINDKYQQKATKDDVGHGKLENMTMTSIRDGSSKALVDYDHLGIGSL